MEAIFTVGGSNNKIKKHLINDIHNKNKINLQSLGRLTKFYELNINDNIKKMIVPSKNLFSKEENISDDLINFAIINYIFKMIMLKPIIDNDKFINICGGENIKFIDLKINQGVDIREVSIEEADLILFKRDISNIKKGSNLLLYVDISQELEILKEISKHFEYLYVYLPERMIDEDKNNTYIYFVNHNNDSNDIDTTNFFIDQYNRLIENKNNFYISCVQLMINRNHDSDEIFNFITCEKVLDIL